MRLTRDVLNDECPSVAMMIGSPSRYVGVGSSTLAP